MNQMHLIQMMFHSPITHTILSWTDPDDRQAAGLSSFGYWQEIARTLERGCFDGVFFADTPAARDDYQGRPTVAMKYGVVWPTQDPLPLVAAMACATERLGFGVTLSTAGTPPYSAVRRISTLDNLSGGRVGWNIVMGLLEAEHRAIGNRILGGHDERYDMADEYMDICYALWDSIGPDAIKVDRESGVFADPDAIKMVDYKGKYFSCRAVSPVMASAQVRPVLFQAGSSGRGMQFAVKHAEAIFAIQIDIVAMKAFMTRLAKASMEGGRAAPPVLFGLQPVIGGSEEDALRRVEELGRKVPIEAALARLSGTVGTDLSKLDPDQPFIALETQSSKGMMEAMSASFKGRQPTLRDVAARVAVSGGLMQIVGSPEQIADQMERIWRETGCHGFNLTATTSPQSINDFVDQVVPILQRRGIFRREYRGKTLRENLLQ